MLLPLFLLLATVAFAVPATSFANVTPAATPDFSMSASPSNLTITAGSMGFSTVTLMSLNGFAGNVTLSTSAPPVGFGVGISPSVLTLRGNGTAQSKVNVNDNFNGTTSWLLKIAGSSGTISHSTTIQINGEPFIAPTFTISAANPFVVAQGFSNSTTVVVSSQHNFNGTVSITTSVFPNVSGGPTLTLSPTQVNVPPGGSGASTLTVSTSLATPIGFYNYTLTGTAPEGGGFITAQFNGALTVEASSQSEFTISANPSSQNVPAGANATSTILLTSVNGFSGTIALSTSPPPLCASCPSWGVTPTKVVLPSGGSASATLVFFTVQGSPPNTYTVTVTGASSNLSHSVNVAFTIVSSKPDFSISANPTNVVVPSGGKASSTITLTSLNGFNGTVSLQTSPSPLCPTPGCTVWSITPTRVNLTPRGSAFATLDIVGGAAGSSGNITVTGTSGSLTHSVNVLFKVSQSAPPDFTISAVPANLTITQGSSATSTITLTSLNGFNGTVTLSDTVSSSMIFATLSRTSVSLPPGGSASVILTVSSSNSTSPGQYSVTVTGASATSAHAVQVGVTVTSPPPLAARFTYSPTSPQIGQQVTFSGSATGGTTPYSFSWSFGDGSTGAGSSVTHTYSAAGSFTVTLTVKDSGASTATSQQTVTISPSPDFTISISPTSQTVHRGSTATYTVTVHGTNGFNGTVTLSATISPVNRHGPTLSLPSIVGPYSTSAMTVATGHNTPQTTYTITVTATSGSLIHTLTVTLTVTA